MFQGTEYELMPCFYLQNGLIEQDDIVSFGESLGKYTGWSKDSAKYFGRSIIYYTQLKQKRTSFHNIYKRRSVEKM